MKKYLFAVAVLIACLFAASATGHAAEPVRLFLNDKQLKPEVPPQITNGTTLVPVRIITEELGAKVTWNSDERKVAIEKDGLRIELVIDKKETQVNGKSYLLETAPVIVNGNTLLPVRFISENMGLKVQWDELTRSVSLMKPKEDVPVTAPVGPLPGTSPVPAGATPAPGGSATPKPTTAPKPGTTPAASPGASAPPGSSQPSAVPALHAVLLEGDMLKISMGKSTEPSFLMLSNPERLVIDLPGAVLSSKINGSPAVQNGSIPFNHPIVEKVRYSLFKDNPNTVRIVVDLKHKIDYNLLESTKPGEIAVSLVKFRYKIVLDAGHGDHDSGAVSVNGRYEKDFNLAIVQKVAKLLEKEEMVQTILTREGDTFLSLDERVNLANDRHAGVFVSVHANKFTKSSVRGVETYWYKEDSRELGDILHRNMVGATGFPDRGLRQNDYRVVKNTAMPAVLCEVGYLSNPAEEQELFKESVQDKVAASIVAGIKEYLQIP